jgi:histidyl-tRNA synthetase
LGLAEHLDAASTEDFAQLRAGLDSLGSAFTVNPRLVRGLE